MATLQAYVVIRKTVGQMRMTYHYVIKINDIKKVKNTTKVIKGGGTMSVIVWTATKDDVATDLSRNRNNLQCRTR